MSEPTVTVERATTAAAVWRDEALRYERLAQDSNASPEVAAGHRIMGRDAREMEAAYQAVVDLAAAREDLATVSREHAALVDVVFKADERIATLQAENEKMKERLRGLGAPRDDATRFLCIKETHVWDSDLAYRTSPEITADQRRAQAELIVRCGHAKRVKYLDSALAQEAGDGR